MGSVEVTVSGGSAVDTAFVRSWIAEIASSIEDQKDYLTQLDAAIGDADHGVNLQRGFSAVLAKLDAGEMAAPGTVLTTVGATLISSVGGASGPLYGTAFREAGKALGPEATFEAGGLVVALRAALAGIQRIGAATEGDKTMVDAFAPAVTALETEVAAGSPLPAAVKAAARAAEEGMRATTPLQARKGRASYLGPRSVGHQDPGATSTALIFAALERVADRATP
jgi:phosphoenolpyruvate---glycerone phosphotransferase subunit DhaL